MEEAQNSSSSEADMADSWTLLNDDSSEPDNLNAETSDSESLEVLEVEYVDQQENSSPKDSKTEKQECSPPSNENDSDNSSIPDFPTVHVIAVKKVKKYVHHPNPYINMWLSVIMVVTIAITLGLGLGHYLGTKRFLRAKNIMHHLQFENQMLEKELANIILKYKYCEEYHQDLVRHFDGLYGNCSFFDGYHCSHNLLQADTCRSYENSNNELNCPTEQSLEMQLSRDSVSNQTVPMFLQRLNKSEITKSKSREPQKNILILSRSQDNRRIKGDSLSDSVHFSVTKVGEVVNEVLSPLFSDLKTELTTLHSLLEKWSDFLNENVRLNAIVHEEKYFVKNAQNLSAALPQKSSCKAAIFPLNRNLNKTSYNHVKNSIDISSHNGCCRSKINQQNVQKEEVKCKKDTSSISENLHKARMDDEKYLASNKCKNKVEESATVSLESGFAFIGRAENKINVHSVDSTVTHKVVEKLDEKQSKTVYSKSSSCKNREGKFHHNSAMYPSQKNKKVFKNKYMPSDNKINYDIWKENKPKPCDYRQKGKKPFRFVKEFTKEYNEREVKNKLGGRIYGKGKECGKDKDKEFQMCNKKYAKEFESHKYYNKHYSRNISEMEKKGKKIFHRKNNNGKLECAKNQCNYYKKHVGKYCKNKDSERFSLHCSKHSKEYVYSAGSDSNENQHSKCSKPNHISHKSCVMNQKLQRDRDKKNYSKNNFKHFSHRKAEHIPEKWKDRSKMHRVSIQAVNLKL